MKALFIFLLTTVVLCSCNKVADPAPDEIQIPAQVIQLVESTYEDPQHMVFTEILQNKIWNVELESRAKKYSSTLSPNHILVTYRLAGTDAPDSLKSLLNPSVITGGTFSNFREQEHILFSEGNFSKTYLADYSWQGEPYLVKWGATFLAGQPTTYNIEMLPVSTSFSTTELNDLPQTLQEYIQKKEFQLMWANISVNAQSKKSYQVRLVKNSNNFELLFDHDCKLVAGSEKPVYLGNGGELPKNIDSYLASKEEYKNFGFTGQFSGIIKHEMDGVKSYSVSIQKHNGYMAGSQVWYFTFDQNGSPLNRKYLGLY
ncbi:hypothetical protein [Dyadobacter sp.]|uniref:hypothetical protein n=1 Tax=Dyadobacter sp. TaxID=1914288 RepID=UPI003F70D35B